MPGIESGGAGFDPSQSEVKKPKRLIPHHIGEGESFGMDPSEIPQQDPEQQLTPQEAHESREERLRKAPKLENRLRALLTERGVAIPEAMNLSLTFIEEFRDHVRDAQDLRKVIKGATDPKERVAAARLYTEKTNKMKEYLAFGDSFEAAYREYIRQRGKYLEFVSAGRRIRELSAALQEPSFQSIAENDVLDPEAQARVEEIMRRETTSVSQIEDEAVLEALQTVYAKGEESEDIAEIEAALREDQGLHSKKEIREEIQELRLKRQELFENPRVRYFYRMHELEKMVHDVSDGADVLETPSVINVLNKLDAWEKEHQRTTIGGVLVGEPGVGKTTLVRHYLEAKGRSYVYIDLSEDVTRYLLFGSKSVEAKNPLDYSASVMARLTEVAKDEASFQAFLKQNAARMREVFHFGNDEAAVAALAQIQDELTASEIDAMGPQDLVTYARQNPEQVRRFFDLDPKAKMDEATLLKKHREIRSGSAKGNPEVLDQVRALRAKIEAMGKTVVNTAVAEEFYHLYHQNGWRDGIIISALRKNQSVILDEFPKSKNWTFLYGLMTAKPGERWFFGENNEYIEIPKTWRMYFTGNIGKRHGAFRTAEALASRAQGKVIEVDYAPQREEFDIALATITAPDMTILRSSRDIAKLQVLTGEILPRLRNVLRDKEPTIPLSLRTIRDLAEKLVTIRKGKNGSESMVATSKSFDEALYEVLVESYRLYDREAAGERGPMKEIVNVCTSAHLMLDESIREKVERWIGKDEYEKRRRLHDEEGDKTLEQIAKRVMGQRSELAIEGGIPEERNF